MTVTRLTPYQQGELAAFQSLLEALKERQAKGETVTVEFIMDFLDLAVSVLEGFDGGPTFEVVR